MAGLSSSVGGATTPDRIVYQCPGSCSRVVLNALEEIGLPYREVGIVLNRGEQYAPDYRALNPKGKVPVLVEDGGVFTELPVILRHLADAHPAARLLPPGAASLSDLIWIAGALHPTAARLFRPTAFSAADPEGVRALAGDALAGYAAIAASRLDRGAWWYGDGWSITDMFLAWVFAFADQMGFSLNDYPAIADLVVRVEKRPSFVRARAVEIASVERDDNPMPPGLVL